jgi:hypothetical protein
MVERLIQAYHPGAKPGDEVELHPYWGAIANTPFFGRVMRDMATAIRTNAENPGAYSYADYEWVDIVLSFELGYYGFLDVHIPDGVGAGIRIEAIAALADGHHEAMTEDERKMAEFIRYVARGTMTDEAYEYVERRLGKRGAIEYSILCAYLQFVIRMWQTLGMPSPSKEEIDQLILDIKEGQHDVSGWKQHMR